MTYWHKNDWLSFIGPILQTDGIIKQNEVTYMSKLERKDVIITTSV